MVDKELIDALGEAGIPERLHPDILLKGFSEAKNIIEAVKGLRPERVQGVMDDFLPDINLYNALGAIYASLPSELRKEALGAFLEQFGRVKYNYVQRNHTAYIREPLVIADLFIDKGNTYYRTRYLK